MGTTATVAGVLGDYGLPRAGRRQPRLPRARRRGAADHEGPVADAAADRGGRADRGGGRAERAAQHHPPGARPRAARSRSISRSQQLRRGDMLVLCSDGLSGQVTHGRDRARRDRGAGSHGGVQAADRPRERRGRPGQHHGHRRALRRRRADRRPARRIPSATACIPLQTDSGPTPAIEFRISRGTLTTGSLPMQRRPDARDPEAARADRPHVVDPAGLAGEAGAAAGC